ncbi:hypothetical protein KJ596_02055 [Patescibacteria group bacterium]|nr:hypothetical protein [Patescibacteria group bacterium]MBU1868726.1 hypothetical protein [Patescibacteria group bacterium]
MKYSVEAGPLVRQETDEQPVLALEEYLEMMRQERVETLSVDEIKQQLEATGVAILTRDYNCGIRISRTGSRKKGYKYTTWTTNDLEDPDHLLADKFGRKNVTID